MFKRFFKTRPEERDAQNLYNWAMKGARKAEFYALGGIDDSYDGRVEFLFMHLGLILHHLRRFGSDGEVLSQSLYDVMVADFDVALREQGVADTGVQRRIKAMIRLFYGRAKLYHEAAEQSQATIAQAARDAVLTADATNDDVKSLLTDYALSLHEAMTQATLADFQNARKIG